MSMAAVVTRQINLAHYLTCSKLGLIGKVYAITERLAVLSGFIMEEIG